MISIIITAKNEARTIRKAVEGFLMSINNYQLSTINKFDFEILVIAPDEKTLKVVQEVGDKVRTIQDKGKSKAAAMNLGVTEAKGDVLIFSDGDVEVAERALGELLKVKGDLVSGRPVPINGEQLTGNRNIFLYWQECLFNEAHRLRLERDKQGKFLVMSGYLFLVKKSVAQKLKLPENLLTEDEYLSYWAWNQGYKIRYAPQAKVRVKFPQNYKDFMLQKVRTLGGSYQIPDEWKKGVKMRSLFSEITEGFGMWKKYVKNFKQAGWMLLLFGVRLQVWVMAFVKIRLLKQHRQMIWRRVESTK